MIFFVAIYSTNNNIQARNASIGGLHQSRSVVDSISHHDDVVPSLGKRADKSLFCLKCRT
jgi:hypothetical protein